MKKNYYYLLSIIALSLSIISCEKDNDTKVNDAHIINEFVLENMNNYYLWTDNISNTLDPKSTEDSKAFFEQMRYLGSGVDLKGDPWSFITDDLQGLKDYFKGIRKTIGYYLFPYYLEDGTDNFALVVAYVYENSPAADIGLKRGSVIMKIDGNYLNRDNANDLLGKDSYEITLGTFDADQKKFVISDTKKSLSAIELNTNPIIKSEVYNINGTKVAYLLYNSFIHEYDKELITEFEKYKTDGVTELVLDFRYNGGGSVASALNISSMIAPQSAIGEVFLKKQYNDELQEYLKNNPDFGQEFLEDNLESKAYGSIDDGIVGTDLPNLNLSRVYIIGLDGTASSSELVINGLKPYMQVITVGKKTHGKYVASITIESEEYPNWAIQPIIFKSANANDVTDYWNGFDADLEIEDAPYLGDFGYNTETSTGELMLSVAIDDITGVTAKKHKNIFNKSEGIKLSSENVALSKIMVYDVE